MMQKPLRVTVIIIGIVIFICFSVWIFKTQFSDKDTTADEKSTASVLIKTQIIKQQTLPLTLHVYGEVATGRVDSLSFPQAGQITQLTVIQNQSVHKDDVIAILTSDPMARSTFVQAQTSVEFAQRELQRNKDLFVLQLATQSQVDAAQKQLSDAQSTLASQLVAGAAKDSVTLKAPVDGVIVAIPVAQGDRVQAGAAIVQLGRADNLRIQLGIEPIDSDKIHIGMPVIISSVHDEKRKVTASISEIHDAIDPKTQLVTAIASIPATKKNNLLVGMQVEADIQLDKRAVWVAPRQAILTDDKGAYLFQVANNKAVRVDVEKILEQHQFYGVDGNINNKLPVVVLGNYELEDGSLVREATR